MRVLITGGAGFIGCNATCKFLKKGDEVIIFDNLSRKGSDKNLEWLKSQGNIEFLKEDLRNPQALENTFKKYGPIDVVLHLAAQVAVTTSVENPREDFEINALGTMNLLEAMRNSRTNPILVYSSTNKVYGHMHDIETVEKDIRYEYSNLPNGVSEDYPLDFYSPYGCSKGAADQYVRDYARTYGLRTIVFRQSCIYGYRQFGVEDQGWVAWFTIASVLNKPLTIYGDGKQIRDVLFIDDMVDSFILATQNINKTCGQVYNIGGGPSNTMSLLELIDYLEILLHKKIKYSFADWRPGDQQVFVSNISKAKKDFEWKPKIEVKEGVKKLCRWVRENSSLFTDFI